MDAVARAYKTTIKEHDNHGILLPLKQFQQQNEYDCGVFATAFFLFLVGVAPIDFCKISAALKPDPDTGTRGTAVEAYCQLVAPHTYIPKLRSWNTLKAPAIVVMQFDGEGHYTVVVSKNDKTASFFDPYTGTVFVIKKNDFAKAWWSENNGERWMLRG
jgi:ABC-type bacteriocin/lantibiotic exporter with double-glycine peptidase domain